MDGKYIIEDGEIKLALSEADFESVLEDVSNCRDILEPQIRIVDNMVVFRDHDIKLIEPELFFLKNIPEYKPSNEFIHKWLFLVIVLVGFSMGVGTALGNGMVVTLMTLAGLVIGVGSSLFHFSIIRNEHHQRHRQALYAKAKLLSFFYMNVLEEMTTSVDRMERSQNRHSREYHELKERHRDVYSALTNDQKTRFGFKFPDGDAIEEKPSDKSKYH